MSRSSIPLLFHSITNRRPQFLNKHLNRGHIADAVNLNYYSFSFNKKLEELDKNTTWLVHCRTGVRSGKTLPIMKELGFTSIIHLDGGTSAWTKEELPLQK